MFFFKESLQYVFLICFDGSKAIYIYALGVSEFHALTTSEIEAKHSSHICDTSIFIIEFAKNRLSISHALHSCIYILSFARHLFWHFRFLHISSPLAAAKNQIKCLTLKFDFLSSNRIVVHYDQNSYIFFRICTEYMCFYS